MLLEKVQYFHADYRDGRVYIGGKVYPAGSFAVHLLNQYYKNDTAARLAVYKLYIWPTLDALSTGYLKTSHYIKAGEEILWILQTLPKLQPFKLLDTEEECNRIRALFSESNGERIKEYFRRRVAVHCMDEGNVILDILPKEYDKRFFKESADLLEDVISTLNFYSNLSECMRRAFHKFREFVQRVDETERLDENHLLPLALEIFGSVVFPVRTEYIQRKKSSRSTTCTIARRMYFEDYFSFIITDFFEGLHYGHYPRRCEICEKYFLMTSARHQQYCTGMSPYALRGKKVSCRKYAAALNRKELAENDPITSLYNRRCSAIRTEKHRGTISADFAEASKRLAAAHKQRAFEDDAYAKIQYALDMERNKLYADIGYGFEIE